MKFSAPRFGLELIDQEIEAHLSKKSGRRIVLTDQNFTTQHQDVEVVDARRTRPEDLAEAPPTHVLYAVDQDDLGLPFILWLVEHNIKFKPIWTALPARWIHKDTRARTTIESEYHFQRSAGFAKFDYGYGDAENICQALGATKELDGAYVEVGCFKGSSGGVALKYMQEAGIYRPSYFLDVFEGFTYPEARSSTDTVWKDSHWTEGLEVVANRLKRFEHRLLGRPVNVLKNNIITDELPPEIERIVVANLDVDQLEAVYWGLVKLAPKIAIGGILIVEDPGHTPLLIGAQAALDIFLRSETARDFLPIYMQSGQYFLVRTR